VKTVRLFLILAILMALAGLTTCAKNPVTGKRQLVLISENQEIAMGQASDPEVRKEYGVVEQQGIQTYIQTLGRKLAAASPRPNLEWHFTVVDSPVVNAFAVPGGYIYITRGILAYINNEAELATVLGHEVGHVAARHSVVQLSRMQLTQFGLGAGSVLSPTFGRVGGAANNATGVLFLRFGRDDERQADQLGVEYAARVGYDPREVSNFFEVLGRLSGSSDRETIPGFLSTHPDPGERVQNTRALAQKWIQQLNLQPTQMTVNRDGHLRNTDGMVFGDNPREGFVENARFYHPELQFQIDFPSGWNVENTKAAVIAIDSQRTAQMQLQLAEVPDGTTADAFQRQLADKGLRPQTSQQITIHGNRSVLAVYVLQAESGNVPVLAGFVEYRRKLYQIVGEATDFARMRNAMEDAIRSFDRITDQRILAAQPDRLVIYTARQGDTLNSIAARLNNPRVNADQLAVLNRMAIDQALTPGRLVKTVTKGY